MINSIPHHLDINNVPTTCYVIVSDDIYGERVGVITGQTKTQITVCVDMGKHCMDVKFMKASKRQVGTPSRGFRYVYSLGEIQDLPNA